MSDDTLFGRPIVRKDMAEEGAKLADLVIGDLSRVTHHVAFPCPAEVCTGTVDTAKGASAVEYHIGYRRNLGVRCSKCEASYTVDVGQSAPPREP